MSYVYIRGTLPWTMRCHDEYRNILKSYKPSLQCVTFLVYSGIRDAGGSIFVRYSEPRMIDSYASAFNVHQRPIKTKHIHKYLMTRVPYLIYLPVFAAPIDIIAHTTQFFFGENMFFFEGGIYFPIYMIFHWVLLFTAYASIFIRWFPIFWNLYFNLLKEMVIINDKIYKLTKLSNRRDIPTRIMHFLTFISLSYGFYYALKTDKGEEMIINSLFVISYVFIFFVTMTMSVFTFGRLFMDLECGQYTIKDEKTK